MSLLSRIFGKSAAELFNDAVTLEKKGMHNEAVQLLKKAIHDNQKFAPAYNLIAWIYAIHNYKLDQALTYANKAVSLSSNQKKSKLHRYLCRNICTFAAV